MYRRFIVWNESRMKVRKPSSRRTSWKRRVWAGDHEAERTWENIPGYEICEPMQTDSAKQICVVSLLPSNSVTFQTHLKPSSTNHDGEKYGHLQQIINCTYLVTQQFHFQKLILQMYVYVHMWIFIKMFTAAQFIYLRERIKNLEI